MQLTKSLNLMRRIKASTPQGKKWLSEILATDDSQTLNDLKLLAEVFGKFESVKYQNKDDEVQERIVKEMTDRRDFLAKTTFDNIRKQL